MRRYKVHYTPEAKADLNEIHDYIKLHSTKRTAVAYIRRLRDFCRELAVGPHRAEKAVNTFEPACDPSDLRTASRLYSLSSTTNTSSKLKALPTPEDSSTNPRNAN